MAVDTTGDRGLEMDGAPLIRPDLISADGQSVRLVLGSCSSCGSRFFPPLERCAHCLSAETDHVLSEERGVVYSATTVDLGPPGFKAPYRLAYVDISGVRVLLHIVRGIPKPNDGVRLVVATVGSRDGHDLRSYAGVVDDQGSLDDGGDR